MIKKKFKRWLLFLFLLPLTPVLSLLIYRLWDEPLSETAKKWKLTNPQIQVGVFSQIQAPRVPDGLLSQEQVCLDDNNKNSELFIQAWRKWLQSNSELYKKIRQTFLESNIQFSNRGISHHRDEFQKAMLAFEFIEFELCYLRLSGQNETFESLRSKLVLNLLRSLHSPNPFRFYVFTLQVLNNIIDEGPQQMDPQLWNSLVSRMKDLKLNQIKESLAQFHAMSTYYSLDNLKNAGFRDPKTWIPVMLLQPQRLLNQMVGLSQEDREISVNANSPWTDVENFENMYLSLFRQLIRENEETLSEQFKPLSQL